MTGPVAYSHYRVGLSSVSAIVVAFLLSTPGCGGLKRNAFPQTLGGEAGAAPLGGAAGDLGGDGSGDRGGGAGSSTTGGTSSHGGRGGSSTGGAGSSGDGQGAAAGGDGESGETGIGGADTTGGAGGAGGAGCVSTCTNESAFECSDSTNVRACVDEGECSVWRDVAECPDGFACCRGLCVRDDSDLGRCSAGGFENPELAVPLEMGRWCSVTLADGVTTDLSWGNQDPCADLQALHPGAVIERAGLYPARGTTAMMVHCSDYTFVTAGQADVLFRMVYDDTVGGPWQCHYLFSPATMPIFQAPFPAAEEDLVRYHVEARMGFDFALDPMLLDVAWFGAPASVLASIVDHYGHDRSAQTSSNDDDGRDWVMDAGTPIYAVANGRVLASRERTVTRGPGCGASEERSESEIYVQHDVGHGAYRESFVSYYGHLADRLVAPGTVVSGGALIGHAGHAGCAAEDGLHFAVTRLTNTMGWYHQPFEVDTSEVGDNGRTSRVEPFGWAGGDVDPWGWRYQLSGIGAWSPRLWKPNDAPPDGAW